MMNQKPKKNIDFAAIRKDFPILKEKHGSKPLVYLDSAASAQKPQYVIDAISHFYAHEYANIHRGIYELSQCATKQYEFIREQVRYFINAANANEILFTKSTTEAINLVAQCVGRVNWKAGDEIILTEMEHHSNIVPWYLLKEEMGLVLRVVPIKDSGALDLDAYRQAFNAKTKMVAIAHVSNALGTINPIEELVAIAKAHQVPVLVDGAQAAPHLPIDMQKLGCDFYAFSGHKIYGPTGIGVLYAKGDLIETMPPYQGGGSMIETVSFDKITYAKGPQKFEAGTPPIAQVIGLGAALHYVNGIGMQNIYEHEQALLAYAEPRLLAIPGLHIIGNAKPKVGVISFILDDIHPHDVGTVLDDAGIAIRAGHHCAMPLMQRLGLPATVRASFGIYNNEQDIDALINAIETAKRLFA